MIRAAMESPAQASSTAPESSVEHCRRLAQEHYENFPVGSRWIRADLRPHMHAVYAFARTADDFADEPEHQGVRLERLAHWRSLLQDAARGKAEDPTFAALMRSIQEKEIPIEWLDQLIQAFELDVVKSRHPSFESILSYAKHSANPVGRLVLWIHGYRDEKLFRLSDSICTALQFANFWQDVAVDWKKDRVYLPIDDMKKFGVTESDLAKGRATEGFRLLLEELSKRTWKRFHVGRPLCDQVGRDLRMELRLVWLGGTRILERIGKDGYDVFKHRPTLRMSDKGLMLWRAFSWKRPQRIHTEAVA